MEIGNLLFNRGIHRSTKFYPFSFRSLESSDEWKELLNCMGLDSYGCIQEDRYDLKRRLLEDIGSYFHQAVWKSILTIGENVLVEMKRT